MGQYQLDVISCSAFVWCLCCAEEELKADLDKAKELTRAGTDNQVK